MGETSDKLETLAIHAGRTAMDGTGDVVPPIHLSTTFVREADGSYASGYVYGRTGNPNRRALETRVAALEGGAGAAAFSSGTAASLAIFQCLPPASHIVATRGAYHGTTSQLREIVAGWRHEVSIVDTADMDTLRGALRAHTRLLWIETPNNPMLQITDIAGCAELCRSRGIVLACDNTLATPVFQRPLQLGADLVMHSSSKYFGGHSDITSGVVVTRTQDEWLEQLHRWQGMGGAVPSPFDCWLLSRSLMTLPCRVRAQADNAGRIARFLAQHPGVESVHYPGLPQHPGHELASTQMSGFGAIVSFCLRGGAEAAWRVCGALALFTPATSLGGVESLVEHRASVEGPTTDTPDSLLRLSVGLENVDDLIGDLDKALQ